MKSFASMMVDGKAGGDTFRRWLQETLPNELPNGNTKLIQSIANFSQAFAGLPGSPTLFAGVLQRAFESDEEVPSLFEKARQTIQAFPSLVKDHCVKIRQSCLQSADWFKAGIAEHGGTMIPKKAPEEFWQKAASFDVPLTQFVSLEATWSVASKLSEVSEGCHEAVKLCRNELTKSSALQNMASVHYILCKQGFLEDLVMDDLAANMPKMQKPVQELVKTMKEFENSVDHPSLKDCSVSGRFTGLLNE